MKTPTKKTQENRELLTDIRSFLDATISANVPVEKRGEVENDALTLARYAIQLCIQLRGEVDKLKKS
jgi:hypothetical protein